MCCGHSAIAASAEPGVGLEVITRDYIVPTPVALLFVRKSGGWRLGGQALVRHTTKLLSFAVSPAVPRGNTCHGRLHDATGDAADRVRQDGARPVGLHQRWNRVGGHTEAQSPRP